jgi:DNA-binding HxlR family transcriptional regulator
VHWLQLDTANCSIARTLDLVGQPWTLLVLREAFQGVRRFEQLQRHLGVSRPVLSQRLRHLVAAGLLERTSYRETGSRSRDEYRLTSKGRDLYPVLLALMQWGDRYVADADGPMIEVRHRDCDHAVRVAMVCDQGHEVESVRDLEARPGPGARELQPD